MSNHRRGTLRAQPPNDPFDLTGVPERDPAAIAIADVLALYAEHVAPSNARPKETLQIIERLDKRLAFIGPAHAQKTPDPAKGFHKYKVGTVEVTALYDGIWEKPHDPAFIKNASVEDTKQALGKAGLT